MKKKSLFLSAALTTFILVLIAGVIKASADAFGSHAGSSAAAAAQVQQEVVGQQATDPPQPTIPPQPTTSPYISPQEAIAIAVARLGSSDLYSIDTTTLGSMDVYKVTFTSGNVVYVSPQGHILVVTSLTQFVEQPSSGGQPGQSAGSSSAPSSGHPSEDDGGGD